MDQVDEAQAIEEAERGNALRLALRRAQDEAPCRVGGGTCLDCGDPIPVARLLAQPSARRCTPCQGLREARAT